MCSILPKRRPTAAPTKKAVSAPWFPTFKTASFAAQGHWSPCRKTSAARLVAARGLGTLQLPEGNLVTGLPSFPHGVYGVVEADVFRCELVCGCQPLNERLETNLSLEAFNASRSKPSFFDAGGWEDGLRAAKVGAEDVDHAFILIAGNNAYQRLDELQQRELHLYFPWITLKRTMSATPTPAASWGWMN